MRLSEIDRRYGIVVEASRSHKVSETDEETMAESEWEEIEVEFSYRKDKKIIRDVLPMSHFMLLYKDARGLIRRGKNYTHASMDPGAPPPADFDVLHYIEEVLRIEREKTGPMYG